MMVAKPVAMLAEGQEVGDYFIVFILVWLAGAVGWYIGYGRGYKQGHAVGLIKGIWQEK